MSGQDASTAKDAKDRFLVTYDFVDTSDRAALAAYLNENAPEGYRLASMVEHQGTSTSWTTFIWEKT
jgi:hypothetical protein